MPSRLSVVVVPPERSAWGSVELKVLIDDRDLVGPVFDSGPWKDPDEMLGTWQSAAAHR